MSYDLAKLYVQNNYPRPDKISEARWRAITLHFQTNGFAD